jgi:nicotinamidase/pyrazinamidase
MTTQALIIIDLQNDFCRKISGGNDIVKPINQLINFAKINNWLIVASRDWHSLELFSDDPSKSHCLKNTNGANFHQDLNTNYISTIISKGENDISQKHYSAFNGDQISLLKLLKENKISSVYLVGLATDYCVKNTAIDSVKNGFKTFVISDACRPARPDSENITLKEMASLGIKKINSSELLNNQ